MECEICTEPFDAARRRPKVLPCGHSYCLACLQGLREKRCPECRREFSDAAEDLLDNFYLLNVSETRPSPSRPRLWCNDCKSIVASDCLLETHTLKSTKAVLKDEAAQLQLQAAQLAKNIPQALRVEDDDDREQALRVLQLARQPGTTLGLSVRGLRGEALAAIWTKPPAAPAGQQQGAAAEAVATDVLVLALAEKGLWQQRGAQGPGGVRPEDQDGATPDYLPILDELKVGDDSSARHRDDLLWTARHSRVRKLANVRCNVDPAWSLQLLRLVAPHVEELQVDRVGYEHWQAVLAMPRLRRLSVRGYTLKQSAFPAELPPLPEHHAGLRWLRVDMPRETTLSLIRAHAGTLQELEMWVSWPTTSGWWQWLRWGFDDLYAALAWCGLAELRRLVLERGSHLRGDCEAQLRAARRMLPEVHVQCHECDEVNFIF